MVREKPSLVSGVITVLEKESKAFEYPADTLGLPAEEMRRLGYRVVDLVVDRLCGKNSEPAILTGSPDDLTSILGGPLPNEPGDAEAALQTLATVALAHQQHGDHPRYFARVPGPSSFAAVLGEWLGTGFNTIAASWGGGSGPATVELVVLEWLRQLMDLPRGTEGVLVSGGALANLTALAVARAAYGPGVAYLTDQTHSTLVRALSTLGFPGDHVRILASDDNMRMPVTDLKLAMEHDRANGRRPLVVAASAGTTNTGAVDPLHEIADLCVSNDVWFHVDGAYGAPAALCDKGRARMSGLKRADSLVLDPHKWLFQPYDVGCALISRPGLLERAFSMNPEYLKDVQAETGEVDFRNRSLELTRRSRALKLWMTFRTYGLDRILAAIQKGIELAEYAEEVLRDDPDTWEVVTPAQIGIVTFAIRGNVPVDHTTRAQQLAAGGYAAVTSTTLKGRSVLRLCTINPLTTKADVRETVQRLAKVTA